MIIAVVGPTGVGKTKMSVELAKYYNGIVINCDAVQVYKDLNIGSAKITEEEKEGVKHYLFDIKNIDEEYTVMDYQKDLRSLLEKNKDKNIIIVGGTGLYLSAGLMDYRFYEEKENKNYDNYSNEELYKLAVKKDKNMQIHPNNRQRLVRFLNKEVHENVELKMLYDAKIIGLTTDRTRLYEIINKRVDKMMNEGLLKEVKTLYKKCPSSKILSSAIGYKELIEYLDGKISLNMAIEKIKLNSRHYAKRQYTWFNNKMNIKWFNVNYENFNETIDNVKKYLANYPCIK